MPKKGSALHYKLSPRREILGMGASGSHTVGVASTVLSVAYENLPDFLSVYPYSSYKRGKRASNETRGSRARSDKWSNVTDGMFCTWRPQ